MPLEITSRPGEDDPLELDHASMPYAGKFGRRRTGTAVLRADQTVIGAVSFSPDRTDSTQCRIRYLAVARDRQGEGIASELATAFVEWAIGDGYASVAITVINPYAVVAIARAGFGYTGETGPRGGVVMHAPHTSPSVDAALGALDRHRLDDEQRRYVRRHLGEDDTAG